MAPLALPPMKLEPLSLTVPENAKEAAAAKHHHLTRAAAKTPTRIPLPVSRTSRQSRYQDNNNPSNCYSSTTSEDEYSGSERELLKPLNSNNGNNNGVKSRKSSDLTVGSAKVGPTTTVYSGSMVVSNSTSSRYSIGNSSSKPSASSSIRTTASTKTPKSNHSSNTTRPHKSTTTSALETRQRKLSTLSPSKTTTAVKTITGGRKHSIVNDILQDQLDKNKSQALAVNLVSAHGLISLPESIKGTNNSNNKPSASSSTTFNNNNDDAVYYTMPTRRKPTLLHERLQGLVDESNHPTYVSSTAWSSLVEREKKSQNNNYTNNKHPERYSDVTVLRGGSTSTNTITTNAKEEMTNLTTSGGQNSSSSSSLEHSKYIREREKGLRVAMSPQGKKKILYMLNFDL